jgi:hypothetical protein
MGKLLFQVAEKIINRDLAPKEVLARYFALEGPSLTRPIETFLSMESMQFSERKSEFW